MNCLATDARTVAVGKEHEARGNLRRLTRASHGSSELFLCLFVHCGGDEWSPNWARSDGIYPAIG